MCGTCCSLTGQWPNGTLTPLALRGRRGVGKTELVKETLRRHGSDTPCLFVEMDEGPQAHPLVFLRSIRDALAQKGLEALLDDQPPRRRHCSDELHFVETLQWLLRRDMIIVLDEFHNCRGTGVPAKLKLMIDDQESTSPSYPLRGRLAVMGSHQQQFQDMFAETEPLHGRIRIKKALEPWTFRTIWDMAQGSGLGPAPTTPAHAVDGLWRAAHAVETPGSGP